MVCRHNTYRVTGCVKSIQGFSLFEIMVTLAVVVVLITLAVPAMGNMLAKQRLKAAESELLAALRFAQTEAIARGQTVVMVRGADDNERIIQVEEGGEVLRHISIDPRLQLIPSAKVAANSEQSIYFTAQGKLSRQRSKETNMNSLGVSIVAPGALALCASNLSGENTVDIFFWATEIKNERREGGIGCSMPNDYDCPNQQWCI